MKITDEIRCALESYLHDQGISASAFAVRLGVGNSTVCKWLSSRGFADMHNANWLKLRPLLAPYLSTPAAVPDVAARLTRLERALGSQAKPAPAPEYAGSLPLHHVPVYGFANGAPSAGELTGDIIPDDEHALERTATTNPRVIAAFQVVGQSMEPDGIHDGSMVLCEHVSDNRDLRPGAIVVTNIDEVLYCKHWRRVGSTILLTSSGPGGKDLEVGESEPAWVLRAVEVSRKL